ncbi:MAG: PHP-associated domain-containing protein [Promethearchaeota archaeon]
MPKFDLHIHTHYSRCGVDSPKTIVKMAIKRKLQGIAITDHNTTAGALQALRSNQELTVIPGIEVSTKDGEILGLGITQRLPEKRSGQETIDLIRDKGGIAVIPHPFDLLRGSIGFKIRTLKFDAIEVYNSNLVFPFANRLARKIADKEGYPTIAGSDAHIGVAVGNAYTIIHETDVDDILEAIRKKRTEVYGRQTCFMTKVRRKALSMLR